MMRRTLAAPALAVLLLAGACSPAVGAADDAAVVPDSGAGVVTVGTAELAALVASGKVRLIDVRTPEEFAEGSIPGAVNVPLDRFDPAAIVDEPGRETVLFCRSDRRSGVAAEQLAAHRDATVRHLDGGILDWIAQGQEVTPAQ
ncbi:rhodanese-like domain-containing protein [Altererythrobacter sp. H2]|uniref:rhodanese-like domain-containing protein n=1 Tax=Altererythrobacter sp. H2 TaxID=3108391 RepID=UPI002B4BBAC6|nr:rhodanese-like domain-containing protein [Altererythrobacter sp. H2]WRK95737.1 rhodanese-like domain-containing protein [Altererythrobacter sp. H2]